MPTVPSPTTTHFTARAVLLLLDAIVCDACVDMKNIVLLLSARQLGLIANKELEVQGEDRCARAALQQHFCRVPEGVRSTFVIAFSPQGDVVASAHGDHKIHVFDVKHGRKLRTLCGHSRTPWSLTWHPTYNNILASGCLAGEVRVWTIDTSDCAVWLCNNCVASLAFHPVSRLLVVAANNEMFFWDWSQDSPCVTLATASDKERVRLVRWSATGDKLITGVSNLPKVSNIELESSLQRRHSLLSRIVGMYRNDMNSSENTFQHLNMLCNRLAQHFNNNTLIANSLLSVLNRLQASLQSLQQDTLTSMHHEHIRQVRVRITEIVMRLISITRSDQATRIREHISATNETNSDILLHCLWLVDTSIQLTQQMANIQISSPPSPRPSTSRDTPSFSIPEVVIDSVGRASSPSPSMSRPRSPPLNEIHARLALSEPRGHMWFTTHPNIIDFRLQCWTQSNPNLKDSQTNLIVSRVRIHNDASIDISFDGQILVCLVPNNNSVNLCLYSLSRDSFAQCLSTWTFGSNAISVSLSPHATFIVVGLTRAHNEHESIIAQVFKRSSRDSLEHVRNISISRGDQVTSVNSIRWLPRPGQGFIYGTNRGQLVIARPFGTQEPHKQSSSQWTQTMIMTQETSTQTLRDGAT